MVHERFRTAQEESLLADLTEALDDELATEVARPACPTALRSGQDNHPLKVRQTLFQAIQLRLEDDVALRPHAVEASSLRIQATLLGVTEQRGSGRSPAAAGDHKND